MFGEVVPPFVGAAAALGACVDEQAGQDWRWKIKVEAALGKDFYRYEMQVGLVGSEAKNTLLSIYLIGKP